MINKVKFKAILRVYKRKMDKCNSIILYFMLPIGLLLAAWAILSIELNIIHKIPVLWNDSTIEGLNHLYLNLSYSYIAGAIIYWFSVSLPYQINKHKISKVIRNKINDIGVQIQNMNIEFRTPENQPRISNIQATMELFNYGIWIGKCRIPIHLNHKSVISAFVQDYENLQSYVSGIINDYKEYLSAEQILLLEGLRNSSMANIFSIGKQSNYIYNEYVFSHEIEPSYKKLIEDYLALTKILSQPNFYVNSNFR